MKKKIILLPSIIFIFALFISCASSSKTEEDIELPSTEITIQQAELKDEPVIDFHKEERKNITLLFGGDIMAHTVNYQISSYEKIWKDVKHIIQSAELAFANIEAPIDTTKPSSSYPNFNMTKEYIQAAIDAGFDIFSLCNNHSNDQSLSGIKETIKSTSELIETENKNGNEIYFSGLKESPESKFSYNLIEKEGWKILFLPITELLNRPDYSGYINYIKTNSSARAEFIDYVNQLKKANSCDLFILSVHTAEPEYTRVITDSQNQFYMDLLDAGADIVWANHAHIIKNRKVIVDTINKSDKLIMYANGNTISGQRTKPELKSKNPTGERDNTGDGLLYKVTLEKTETGSIKLIKAEPLFITTYINTANEFIIKPLNQDFVDYLNDVARTDWADYIKRRIKINKEETKDLIEWQ